MSDEEKDGTPPDLRELAMKMLEHPDKELGLLWGDLLRGFEQGRAPGATPVDGLRELFVFQTRALFYLQSMTSELRYRLEALELAIGVSHHQNGEPSAFPPSGREAPKMELAGRSDNLATRIHRLEVRAGLD